MAVADHITVLSLCTVLLSACASVSTRLPDISLPELASEQASQERAAFAEMNALQARLNPVAFNVLRANTSLCPKTRLDIGLTTHKLKSYTKALRPAAAREIGAKSYPSVLFVREGSEADKAGIVAGDILIDEQDVAIDARDKRLQARLKSGQMGIRLRRGDAIKVVTVAPIEVCDYPVRLSMRSTVNAYATGKALIITSGMMGFTKTDSELALIVGHELAHNTMGHIRKIVTNSILTGMGTKHTRPFELEADYVGLYYTARAGYDIEDVDAVWRRMGVMNPKSVARAKSHPTYPDRYVRMQAAVDEIEQKRAQGEALVPNFLSSEPGDGA